MATYSLQQPYETGRFPASLPQYATSWGSYVPSNALSMSYQNFTFIREGDPSLYQGGQLLSFLSPRAMINYSDVSQHLVVTFEVPNATVDVLFLSTSAFSTVSSSFARQGLSSFSIGSAPVYQVLSYLPSGPSIGWAALVDLDHALLFSEGVAGGRTALTASLNVLAGGNASMLSRDDVRHLLYTLGGASGHYSLTIQNFQGVVLAGQMTAIAVDNASTAVRLSYTVKFRNQSSSASTEYSLLKSAYLSAHQFWVYDSYAKAVQLDPPTSLGNDVRLGG